MGLKLYLSPQRKNKVRTFENGVLRGRFGLKRKEIIYG
jgi:hypothetical protein